MPDNKAPLAVGGRGVGEEEKREGKKEQFNYICEIIILQHY